MEGTLRKPFQGVMNIIRFNWHFYVLSLICIIVLVVSLSFLPQGFGTFVSVIIWLIITGTFLSLSASFYVYDRSNLYTLQWLNFLNIKAGDKLVNIHAGFDETSYILANAYSGSSLRVFDFYDPSRHTEISIKRARKAYPPYPGTSPVPTSLIPLEPDSVNFIFAILAVHEIRNREERIAFFKSLHKSLGKNGKIVVVEHLRDVPNFIAYNAGFFHFFSKKEWKRTFSAANLHITKEIKLTPFLSAFILEINGIAS